LRFKETPVPDTYLEKTPKAKKLQSQLFGRKPGSKNHQITGGQKDGSLSFSPKILRTKVLCPYWFSSFPPN
jgi:hypothetical protein